MAKRSKRKRSKPPPTGGTPALQALARSREQADLHRRAGMATAILIECPTFVPEVVRGELTMTGPRVRPAVCAACGRTPGVVEERGCPRAQPPEVVIGAMLPKEALFG